MWTFGWSWTRLCCYADHVVGWRCERSVEVEHASAATLIMGWGGVGMLTFVCSWTRHACYAEHVVGWRCERSVEVEHASAATLIMGWGGVGWGGDVNVRFEVEHASACYADHGVGWGGDVNVRLQLNTPLLHATLSMWWGGDVNVRLKLNTPLLLRWACVGVEMWTFGWSWTRLCCYADHGVGWGGVGMLTFVCSWTRHACYAEHVVGWRCERSVEVEHASAATLIMWWGGDVNVRLKLNTPLLLRWSWGGVGWGC